MQVYKITNLLNNRIYIGQDSNSNPNYFGSGKLIKQAIKKYGKYTVKQWESLLQLGWNKN